MSIWKIAIPTIIALIIEVNKQGQKVVRCVTIGQKIDYQMILIFQEVVNQDYYFMEIKKEISVEISKGCNRIL